MFLIFCLDLKAQKLELPQKYDLNYLTYILMVAGALGIEPRNVGIKNRCLTAWLSPNINSYVVVLTTAVQ